MQLFASIVYLPPGPVLDVKLDQNGAISLIRRVYVEITLFTLLPTGVTERDVPWLVRYLFS